MICQYCTEPSSTEDGWHRECKVRAVLGSVAHFEKRCGCYVPGSTEGDPPGTTLRQGAIAAYKAWLKNIMYERRN